MSAYADRTADPICNVFLYILLPVWFSSVLASLAWIVFECEPDVWASSLIVVYIFSLVVGSVVSAGLVHLRSRVRAGAVDRKARLVARCRRFVRKHSYRIQHSRQNGKYCWTKMLGECFPHGVAVAHGPRVTRRTFFFLLRSFQTMTTYLASSRCYLRNNHLQFASKEVPHWAKFDSSAWVGNPQHIIDVASSVGAASFGTPYAGEIFREAVKSAIVVNTAVTEKQRKAIEAELEFPVVFKKITPMANDHQVIAAFREIARQVYDSCFKVARTKLPTLVVGAAAREFTKYAANNYIHYYFHDSEAKDYDRTVKFFLEDFVAHIAAKASKKNRNVRRDSDGAKPAVEKTWDSFKAMLDDYREMRKVPDKLKLGLCPGYEALLLEDSMYNFTPQDYKNLFKTTGANVAYGYGILPLEILYPELPRSQFYNVSREGGKLYLDFSYSNGYVHDELAWATLLRHPVMNFDSFALVVEIVAYSGPMAVFKIIRVNKGGETISRAVALPRKKQYVKVLDLINSCNVHGVVKTKRYFSVFADEYFETLNYCLSIDPRSLTLQNTMTFVRRRAGGISLISKELLAPWNLRSRDFHSFALTVYLTAKLANEHAAAIDGNYSSLFKRSFVSTFGFFFSGSFEAIKAYLRQNELLDALVIYGTDELKQRHHITIANPEEIKYNITLDEAYVEKVFQCPICERLDGKLGDQVVKCEHKAHEVTVKMTDADIAKMEMVLADDDNDPPGLRNVKERAKKSMPKLGFSHTCRFHYILGGPGCGKSYIIRQLATKFDMVYAPFTKLMPDYKNLKNEFGEAYDLHFATIHRGLESRCISTIFIDEFTSLPMEYIKMVIAVNKAEDVFIVGDTRQSRVQTNEGTYIGDEIDIDTLPRHTLMRNFRNPKDAVALLNGKFGYEMEAMSKINRSIHVFGPNEVMPEEIRNLPFHKFTFSYGSMAAYNLCADDTVRKYQGSTVKHAMLFVDANSAEETAMNDNLVTVALSRHVETLVIRHDASTRALSWLQKYQLLGEQDLSALRHHEKAAAVEDLDFEAKAVDKFVTDHFSVRVDNIVDLTNAPKKSLRDVFRDFVDISVTIYKEISFGILRSQAVLSYAAIYFGFSALALVTDNVFLVSTVVPFVKFQSKVLLLNQYVKKIHFLARNADVLLLFTHFAAKVVNWICYDSSDSIALLHFFDYPYKPLLSLFAPLLDYWYVIYIAAKINYIARIFSLDHLSFNKKFYTILVMGNLLALFMPIFKMDYFCDFLSTPVVVGLTLLMRRKNFRFGLAWPGFSYDSNTFMPIIDHQVFINLVGGDFAFSSQEFYDYMFYYVPVSIRRRFEQVAQPEVRPVCPIEQAPMDAYRLFDTLVPSAAGVDTVGYHNNVGSLQVEENHYTGAVSPDVLNPLNLKFKPQKLVSKFYRLLPGTGNAYDKKSISQLLQVFSGRYFNKKPTAKRIFNDDAVSCARKIVDEFFFECMDPVAYSESDLETVTNEFAASAAQKKYESMFKGFDNADTHTIRFHLKDIFKPKVGSGADPEKCGQGISAWNKDPQVMFGVGARFANFMFAKHLRQHCVYDNRMTPEQMKEKLLMLMRTVPSTSKNGITDFTMFDSQQDRFTQEIEKQFMRRLMFSDEFIEHYYSFRSGYTIIGGPVKGSCRNEKTSGEPMTLFMNTVISAVLSNYFLRGEGPFCLAIKGDDGFERQANLKMDTERYDEVAEFTALKMKVDISEGAEFCGFVITDAMFVESIPRKLHKLLSHRFRDYKHFAQYQQSLRDFVSQFEDDTLFRAFIKANVDMYRKVGMSDQEMMSFYNAIKSFAHINQEQFFRVAQYVEMEPIYKRAEGGVLIQGFASGPVVHNHQHDFTCKGCAAVPCDLLMCAQFCDCEFVRSTRRK